MIRVLFGDDDAGVMMSSLLFRGDVFRDAVRGDVVRGDV